MDKFLRSIINLIVALVVDKKELSLVLKAFHELDTDYTGTLTENNFWLYKNHIKKAGIEENFETVLDLIDLDKNK